MPLVWSAETRSEIRRDKLFETILAGGYPPAGGVLENFVLMELHKQSTWSKTQPRFFYWRTASGQEVDIVLEDSAGRLVGVEVKATATLGRDDVRGFKALAEAVGKRWLRKAISFECVRSTFDCSDCISLVLIKTPAFFGLLCAVSE